MRTSMSLSSVTGHTKRNVPNSRRAREPGDCVMELEETFPVTCRKRFMFIFYLMIFQWYSCFKEPNILGLVRKKWKR